MKGAARGDRSRLPKRGQAGRERGEEQSDREHQGSIVVRDTESV